MSDEDDDFSFEDQEAIDAANRLYAGLGSSAPVFRASAVPGAPTFRVSPQLLKDAVLVATLKGKIKEADRLHFSISSESVELSSRYKGVETRVWLKNERDGSAAEPHSFTLPHIVASRLVALPGLDVVHAQIQPAISGENDRALRLKLGSSRVTLSAAPAFPTESLHTDPHKENTLRFGPLALKMALHDALEISTAAGPGGVVSAAEGRVFAGGPKAVIAIVNPDFTHLNFDVSAEDCRVLTRIVGRMRHGRACFYATEKHFIFFDELITCRVSRTKGVIIPINDLMVAPVAQNFVLDTVKTQREGLLVALAKPATITFTWPGSVPSFSDNSTRIALFAATPGMASQCRSSLKAGTESGSDFNEWTISVDGRVWLAAMRVFDFDSRMELNVLKAGAFFKITGT